MVTATAGRIFDDLLTLEVNIIVKPGMTARKMPKAHHALLDVIGDYDQYLCEQAVRLNASAAPGASPLRIESGEDIVKKETFDDLRERAKLAELANRALLAGRPDLDDGQGIILKRIYRNCDQIKGILDVPAVKSAVGNGIGRDSDPNVDLPLTADEILTVRKVWEVGIETIVMQTVAQLDGDIVTRVQRARVAASNAPVHTLHRNMTESALKQWQFLFQTVAQFTGKALQGFLAR